MKLNGAAAAIIQSEDCAVMPTALPADRINIRPAKPEDAKQLFSLILELAEHQEMPDGPKIGPKQLAADFRAGHMRAMLAMDAQGEMAAYACYYLQPSSSISRGQLMHLEDLYIRPQFRRKGLGPRLLRELAKVAHILRLPFIEWSVLRTNYGAIKFYKRLAGLEDLTDQRETNKAISWRLSDNAFEHILRKAKPMPVEVLVDEAGMIEERKAKQLAEQWQTLVEERKPAAADERKSTAVNARVLAKLLQSGQMGAVCVRKAAADDEQTPQKVVGMALFHTKAYSTWRGRFPELDQIYVAEDSRRKGVGTAIIAELVKVAKSMGALKIEWVAPEPSKAKCQHVPFFESLNAVNNTDCEGWLLYRWNYEQSGMHEEEEKENAKAAAKDDC